MRYSVIKGGRKPELPAQDTRQLHCEVSLTSSEDGEAAEYQYPGYFFYVYQSTLEF